MDKSIYDVEHKILADSETARFLCFPNDEQNRQTLVDRASLTINLKCPNVLAAKCVSLDSTAKKVILIHDFFESYFEKPISENTKKPKPAFAKGHRRLDASWRNIIRSALDGIHFLHKNQLIHGALSEDVSYVMQGGSICLVLPRESWAERLKDSKNELAFTLEQWNDLCNFKIFLTRHLNVKKGAHPDWDSFLHMFSLTKMNASCLRKHPLLMDDIEVFYYFDATCCRLACADQTYHSLIISILRKMPNKWCVKGWDTFISKRSIAESVYKYPLEKKRKRDAESVKPYDPHSPEEMLRFILNIVHHAGQHASDHFISMMYSEENIAAEITEMYPGYLSTLHEMWMTIPSDSISEYSYGSYLGRDANRR